MKNHRVSTILPRAALGALVLAALAAVAASTARADTILFQDTFDVGYIQCDVTENIATAGRQSGTLVGQLGPINYWTTTYWGSVIAGATFNTLFDYNGYSCAPLINFNGYTPDGMTVDYDMNVHSDVWGTFTVGDLGTGTWSTAPNVTLITLYDAAGGTGGLWQLFENGALKTGGALPVSIADGLFHHYQAVFTDSSGIDTDPFNGSGQTDVAYYIDGSLITTYTPGAGVGGLTNAYAHLSALGWYTESDNLTVTQIPEPGTLALLALPGLAIFWLRLRKK
jgi:hypothetical protein